MRFDSDETLDLFEFEEKLSKNLYLLYYKKLL